MNYITITLTVNGDIYFGPPPADLFMFCYNLTSFAFLPCRVEELCDITSILQLVLILFNYILSCI